MDTSTRELVIEDAVLKLARHIADAQGVEVIWVKMLGKGKRSMLRVTIDRDDGVTLDDCERFSRGLDLLLENEDIMQGTYTLEVSSPGLDRPLAAIKDFQRNIGKLARIITKEKLDNQNFFIGRIMRIEDDLVILNVNGHERGIYFDNISKARLEIEVK